MLPASTVLIKLSGMLDPAGVRKAVAASQRFYSTARQRVIPKLASSLKDADRSGHTVGHCAHAGACAVLLGLAPLLSGKVQLPQILEWVVHPEAQANSCPIPLTCHLNT